MRGLLLSVASVLTLEEFYRLEERYREAGVVDLDRALGDRQARAGGVWTVL